MEVKTPVYFGVSREIFYQLSRKARQLKTSRSGVAGEAVRAYLASPFPVRGYRLERGEQFRRIATFLTAQEHAQLRALAEQFGTDEAPVSIATIIREALRHYLANDSSAPPPAPPRGIIPTVPAEQAKGPERPPGEGEKTGDGVLSPDDKPPHPAQGQQPTKKRGERRGGQPGTEG